MARLIDAIEAYLRELLQANAAVEVQRSDLAHRFQCAPSQINYVLATRFTPERGFLVESRRGGGGYVRVIQINLQQLQDLHDMVYRQIGPALTQDEAHGIVARLAEAGWITLREATMMMAALDRETLLLEIPLRDRLRSSILRAMLLARMRHGD